MNLTYMLRTRRNIAQSDIGDFDSFVDVITYDLIKMVVARVFSINIELIDKKKRNREIVIARQLCHFFAKKYKLGSLSEIGMNIGMKDHATVLHSCKVVDDLYSYDKKFIKKVNDIDFYLKR